MFENYSLADLGANLYKKRWVNLLAFCLIALAIAGPLVWRTIQNSQTTTPASKLYYSTTSLYTLELPQAERLSSDASPRAGGYSDYYYYLLYNNLNGAFLVSGVDEPTVKQLAQELGMTEQVLRNAKPEVFEKLAAINNLGNNGGITFNFYTTSLAFNTLATQKFDQLLAEHAKAFPNVTLSKSSTITSEPIEVAQTVKASTVSVKQLAVQAIAGVVGAALVVTLANVALYLFRPTVNRIGDLGRYGLDFVYQVDTAENALEVLQVHTEQSVTFVVAERTMAQAVQTKWPNSQVLLASDLKGLRQAEAVVLVGEFGKMRYAEVEFVLNQLQAIQKQPIGALMLPL